MHNQLEGDLGVAPELAGGIMCHICLGNTLGSPSRSWNASLRRGASQIPCCHHDPTPDKWKKNQMDTWIISKQTCLQRDAVSLVGCVGKFEAAQAHRICIFKCNISFKRCD